MLTQLFLAARIENVPPLLYVRRLLRLGFPAAAPSLNEISPELATQFLDLQFNELVLTDRFLLSAWGTLSARMRPLLTETVIRSLTSADFQVSDLMTGHKPVTLYLRWPERDFLALSPLNRLFWGSLIDELITTYDKQDGKNCNCKPALLLIDEAGRTAIPSLADHAKPLLAGEFPCGLPSSPSPSLTPSTEKCALALCGTTWRAKFTTVLQTSRPQIT